jgi:hypothetical protein
MVTFDDSCCDFFCVSHVPRDWAEAAAKRGNNTVAHHFKAMANAEQAKDTFRKLKNIIKPQDKSGIKRLQVPRTNEHGQIEKDDNGEEQWKLLTDPEEIERTIITRNIQHFGQANDTLFNNQAFTDIFGIDGDSEATKALLRGVLPNIDKLPVEVQLILKEIAKSPQPTIEPTISTKDLKGLFKTWKETTSTSPSGCHLGHWHALLAPDGTIPNPDSDEDPIEDNIMKIHTFILNSSIQSGIPLARWAVVHSSMIAKTEGHPRINKLRVIHLYEADYNGFLKIIWPHRAVHNATARNLLNDSQAGGQKGRQSNHTALQKENEIPLRTTT